MKVCTTCGAEYGDEKLFCERDGTSLRKSGGAGDLVGQVIAERYHITKKLGEGGMGQVYLAEHVKMGRRCAIKIMTPGTMSDPDAISRFNREAANASRISHPNVCAIYDFGETPDGLIYLAMEFIEGKSLSGLMEEAGTLPLARAALIVTQTAEALQVAHDLGIVHRDLKPDNIMVITARGKDTVKVVDFGIAKAIGGDEGKGQKVTKTGFVVGTPEYMSPEQLSGDPVDGRSDNYSLGLVFYKMLTGASPFPADSQQETMIKRLTDDPLPLAAARPAVRFPPELQRVMDRALARSPAERFRTAGDFAREVKGLSSVLTGQVDAEAGTQVVRPEDLKAAVPATRVDPAAGRAVKPAPKPQAAAAPPGGAPAGTRLPLVPIAVAVAVLAVGGGGYAFRDAIFGGANPDSSQTQDTSRLAGGTPIVPESSATNPGTTPETVTPLSGRDTATKPPQPGGGRPTGGQTNPGGTPTNPGGAPANPGGTSTNPPVTPDHAALERQVLAYYDDLGFEDDPSKRLEARRLGQQVFTLTAMPRPVRAKAAWLVMQGYLKEGNADKAREWLDQAIALDPSQQSWKTVRAQM